MVEELILEVVIATLTLMIVDNVISVGTSGDTLNLQLCCNNQASLPNLSRNVITNPQGNGIAVNDARAGVTIDSNTIAARSQAFASWCGRCDRDHQ